MVVCLVRLDISAAAPFGGAPTISPLGSAYSLKGALAGRIPHLTRPHDMRASNAAAGVLDRRGVESCGNAAGHGEQIVPRPILTLKRKPAARQADGASGLEPVPLDAEVSFVNWRRGHKRPTRRYMTAEAALREAARLRFLHPDAVIYTYRLELLREGEK